MAAYAYLPTPWGQVAYRKIGRGPRLLIAWHSFGSDSHAFECLEQPLHDSCTIFAPDLPFHGRTDWSLSVYTPRQLRFIINAVLALAGKQRFEAVGHSLGGRLWLCLLPELAERLDALYLLAPDGLYTRAMGLAEWPPLPLRRLAGLLASYPATVQKTLEAFDLADHYTLRFLQQQLGNAAQRQRLLKTWYALSRFPLNPRAARRNLHRARTPALVLLGQHDKLISNTEVRGAFQGLENVLIQEVSATHQSLCAQAAPFLSSGLLPYWNHFNLVLQRQNGQ